jgi:hypothetical protein
VIVLVLVLVPVPVPVLVLPVRYYCQLRCRPRSATTPCWMK